MLLDKVTCLTSALFSSSSCLCRFVLLPLSLFFFLIVFLEQGGGGDGGGSSSGGGGGGGWEGGEPVGGQDSALYILLFFSAKNDSPTYCEIIDHRLFQPG